MNNKYVFILSADNDVSVDKVISWIKYYNVYDVVRINTNDKIRFIDITIANDGIKFNIIINDHLKISSKDIYSYWYRRGEIKYAPIQYFGKLYDNIDIGANINKYYSLEFEHTIEALGKAKRR
ncbi:MAG: hypothetical protein JST52_06650 [Bacteroidetes bacterium]|nr:hypothetical protein [Bacteroidota bacterium]MBS1740900.1 hypothetical protein [Bacteroidota bacterium]MBS1775200.1 hypothetical protein [Bacteroidota bacterium]